MNLQNVRFLPPC